MAPLTLSTHMNHQGVTLTELVFEFFKKAKDNVSTDKTIADAPSVYGRARA